MRRNDYVDLLLEKMRMPDGSYGGGFSVPTLHDIPRASAESASNLQKNNPLSLHEDVSRSIRFILSLITPRIRGTTGLLPSTYVVQSDKTLNERRSAFHSHLPSLMVPLQIP